jgi:26S proteasome regulatory subunit T1
MPEGIFFIIVMLQALDMVFSMSVERDIRFDLIARLCPNTTGAELRSVATEVKFPPSIFGFHALRSHPQAGMFAIRARRKVASERDFLDAVEKVVRQGTKFSSTYGWFFLCSFLLLTRFFHLGHYTKCTISCISLISLFRLGLNDLTQPPFATVLYTSMSTLHVPSCIHHLHPIVVNPTTLAFKRSALACNAIHTRSYQRGATERRNPPNTADPPRPVTLSSLLSFGRPVTPESVLKSFVYVKQELPRRLAMRVRAFEALPFIVGTNPYISKTLERFKASFEEISSYPLIKDTWENAQFVSRLERLVQSHANDIPTLAKGYMN